MLYLVEKWKAFLDQHVTRASRYLNIELIQNIAFANLSYSEIFLATLVSKVNPVSDKIFLYSDATTM